MQGLSKKPSRWTKMSDLITLIHSENNPRRFQKTQEDTTLKRRARRQPHLYAAHPLLCRFSTAF